MFRTLGGQSAWEAAVGGGGWAEETFADSTLEPGVSVTTSNGSVSGGVWDDMVDGSETTTWQFNSHIWAWGGDWNPNIPGGPGSHLLITLFYKDGNSTQIDNGNGYTIVNTTEDEFWGFVTDMDVVAVNVSEGLPHAAGVPIENYDFDNMVWMVPEPGTLALMGLGLIGAGFGRKWKSR